jgi:hypothetical protein
MNAMLDPRMVAARIQGRAFALHEMPAFDRITASSQGGFTQAVDARVRSGDSEALRRQAVLRHSLSVRRIESF